MGREIRRVPANWEHPKMWVTKHTGAIDLIYKPLHQRDYAAAVETYRTDLAEWLEGQRQWASGIYDGEPRAQAVDHHRAYLEEQAAHYGDTEYHTAEYKKFSVGPCYWSDWAGDLPRHPSPDDYMPHGEWWQLYETVSEGTPQSPPFATAEELIIHLSTVGDFRGHIWDRESAASMVGTGWAPSMVMNASGLHQPEDKEFWKATSTPQP